MGKDGVTIYQTRGDGSRAASVSLGGLEVLVTPVAADLNDDAVAAAKSILDSLTTREELLRETERLRRENEALRDRLRSMQAKLESAEERAIVAATGRRRFFTEVLLVPTRPGEWTGSVLLLDPIKKWHGRALEFRDFAELRKLHPELWIVGVTSDGILLDAWGHEKGGA